MKTTKKKKSTAYVGFRTTNALKIALLRLAAVERRTVSNVIEIVLEDLLIEDSSATQEENHLRALGRFTRMLDKNLPA